MYSYFLTFLNHILLISCFVSNSFSLSPIIFWNSWILFSVHDTSFSYTYSFSSQEIIEKRKKKENGNIKSQWWPLLTLFLFSSHLFEKWPLTLSRIWFVFPLLVLIFYDYLLPLRCLSVQSLSLFFLILTLHCCFVNDSQVVLVWNIFFCIVSRFKLNDQIYKEL